MSGEALTLRLRNKFRRYCLALHQTAMMLSIAIRRERNTLSYRDGPMCGAVFHARRPDILVNTDHISEKLTNGKIRTPSDNN